MKRTNNAKNIPYVVILLSADNPPKDDTKICLYLRQLIDHVFLIRLLVAPDVTPVLYTWDMFHVKNEPIL